MNPEDIIPLPEFVLLPDTVDLNVRDSSAVQEYVRDNPNVYLGTILSGGEAIIYTNEGNVDKIVSDLGFTLTNSFPVVMGLLGESSLEAAGIIQVQQQPFLDLRGQGVLLGFIDTGIDYTLPAFIYEDGTSKVFSIWDQTINTGGYPEGFYFGTEYTNQQINAALRQPNPLDTVPHRDDVGHGTFLASVAGSRERGEYIGAAPDSEIIMVKLKKARPYYLNRYLVPEGTENVFESTDVMLGIEYITKKGAEFRMPVSICIGIGTNLGGHDSYNALEEYLRVVSDYRGVCICTGAGNESRARHHTNGRILSTEDSQVIEIGVDENSASFPVYIWNNFTDRMSVSIKSPTGEIVSRVPARSGITFEERLVLERATIIVEYNFPLQGSGSQLTTIKILNPTPGIWSITIYGDIILDGTYQAWLPMTGLVSPGIEFLTPSPNYTIVIPATSVGSIASGAYNDRTNNLFADSSWGPTREGIILPDLTSPGVNVSGIYPNGRGTMTGTSVSSSITAGACALMLQWGIVERNDIRLNTYRVKAYLIRGCNREPNIEYPSLQWGYGTLNLINTFNQLRSM